MFPARRRLSYDRAVLKASPVIASVYLTPDKRLTVYDDGRRVAYAQ
jgi:hypothetical protein